MDNKKEENSNTLVFDINILKQTRQYLEETELNTFQDDIHLYGIINYTRTQLLTQLSKKITEQEEYKDIFYNYTSIESMILDLLMIIESNTVKKINHEEDNTSKTNVLKIFTIKLLNILEKLLYTKQYDSENKDYEKKLEKHANELFNLQNDYYKLIYDEKIDFRIKQ